MRSIADRDKLVLVLEKIRRVRDSGSGQSGILMVKLHLTRPSPVHERSGDRLGDSREGGREDRLCSSSSRSSVLSRASWQYRERHGVAGVADRLDELGNHGARHSDVLGGLSYSGMSLLGSGGLHLKPVPASPLLKTGKYELFIKNKGCR